MAIRRSATPPPKPVTIPTGKSKTNKKGSGVQTPGGTTTSGYVDTWQFGVNGENQPLGNQPLQGGYEFFGQPGSISGHSALLPTLFGKGVQGTTLSQAKSPMTLDQAMLNFTHMTGYQLATIQSQLYRAGFYSGNFTPTYGKVRTEDISAFRSMLVGVGMNPQAQPIGQYLSQSADQGDNAGVNLTKHAPLVIKLTNPDTLRATIQNVADQLYGGHLPDDEVQKMITTYQGMESSSQTAQYNAGDPNLTGVVTGGLGGTITQAPSPSAYAQSQIEQNHPDQVNHVKFKDTFSKVLDAFTKPTV